MKNSYKNVMHSNYWTEFLMNFGILCTYCVLGRKFDKKVLG